MTAGHLGFIDTPHQGNLRPAGVPWCADNGCFSTRFEESHWWRWLVTRQPGAGSCAFAVAPDVVADAVATEERSRPWLPRIRALGYPVAYVAQDGLTGPADLPWASFDVLFVGGTTAFKLGPIARGLVAEARSRGMGVHMGRVNSERRFAYAAAIGCTSVDGTFLTFGPTSNLPHVLAWIRGLEQLAFPIVV